MKFIELSTGLGPVLINALAIVRAESAENGACTELRFIARDLDFVVSIPYATFRAELVTLLAGNATFHSFVK